MLRYGLLFDQSAPNMIAVRNPKDNIRVSRFSRAVTVIVASSTYSMGNARRQHTGASLLVFRQDGQELSVVQCNMSVAPEGAGVDNSVPILGCID